MSVDLLASAALISRTRRPRFDHLGPRVELITALDGPQGAPGLIRGRIAPDQAVPMHSHAEPETFFVLDGALEGLTFGSDGVARWAGIGTGEAFFVPPNARHALRNVGSAPATTLIITTTDLVRFFETTGRPVRTFDETLAPPSAEYIQDFIATALDHGHWLASPEENAAVGIRLPDDG